MNLENKVCFNCKKEKPVTDFYRSNTRYYQRECKDCNRERKYKWHQTDAGKLSSANTKLKRRFGIDLNEYNQMLKAQDGKCLICGATESIFGHKLAVDHCHKTNKIRGLLCKSCNVGLGHFKDNIKSLLKAAEYLKNHEID
jgi:hypothetical protein